MNTAPISGKRKSVRLEKDEYKALKNFVKEFHTFTEAAEAIGVSFQVLDRAILAGQAAQDTIEKIRKALQNGQA